MLCAAAPLLAGCGGPESILRTDSKSAHDIALLWWWMMAAAGIVLFGSLGMLALGWFRRNKPGLPFFGTREDVPQGLVLVFGIAIPLVALVALFGVANIYLVGESSPPNPKTTNLTIDVIGHQWWWEVHYPGTGVDTANEIHIPTNTRVDVLATTADVIHSFWVPALNRKIDMIPGITNRVLLDATSPGVYSGQCSQYCGLQHAHMGMRVFAQPPAAFHAWLTNQERPPVAPQTSTERTGEQLFMGMQCASCHTIAGTPAQGGIGPDLTHLATRSTLAAGEIPNDPHWLAAWIRNPQAIKPGTRMPDLGLGSTQIAAIVAYLGSLR
ncbi:MAG: cytochrome c oxidase subunit II [Solirubrobacteraceae bacterium]